MNLEELQKYLDDHNITFEEVLMDNINAEVVCGNVEPIVVSGDVAG